MENEEIFKAAASDIPRGWLYCFNSGCTVCSECVRYRSAESIESTRTSGMAVYPTATAGGRHCTYFKRLRTIRSAWGFGRMFADVKAADAPRLRAIMKERLGGNGMYYRYHHGLRRLNPEQQEWIKALFRRHGYGDAEFDHYREEVDFT